MPYSRITSTSNGAASIRYALNGSGHDGSGARNQIVSGIFLLDNNVVSYIDQMEAFFRKKGKSNHTETWRVVQSFGTDELDPDNAQDIIAAHEIGRKSAEQLFPNRQVVVATQTDSIGHKIHNHIIANNIDMLSGKGMRHSDVYYTVVRAVTDQIARDYVHAYSVTTPQAEVINQTVRMKRQKNEERIAQGLEPEYIWQDDLRNRIKEAAAVSDDFTDFERRLFENGVSMDLKMPKNPMKAKRPEGYITYELTDVSGFPWTSNEAGMKERKLPRNLRSRSYKLGYDFGIKGLEETFLNNRGRGDTPQQKATEKPVAEAKHPKAVIPVRPEPTVPSMEYSEEQAVSVNENESGKPDALEYTDEPVIKPKRKVSDGKLAPAREAEPEKDMDHEEMPAAPVVSFDEAEEQAKEYAVKLYCELNMDYDLDWEGFKSWRTHKRKEDGDLDAIYNKDKYTGSVSVIADNLTHQLREFISVRKKQQEEEKIKNLEEQLSRDKRGSRAESVLDILQDALDSQDEEEY